MKDVDQLNSTDKFTSFFFRHGFAEEIMQNNLVIQTTKIKYISEINLSTYSRIENILSYKHDPVIPFKILNLDELRNGEKSKSGIMEIIFNTMQNRIVDLAHRTVLTGLTYRMQMVLDETIQNVIDHAYTNSDYLPVMGLYCRYREGKTRLDKDRLVYFNEEVKREQKRSPFLTADYLSNKEGCMEVFVTDHGVGIYKNFINFDIPEKIRKSKQPIKELLKTIFSEGLSSREETSSKGDAGGLTVIQNQMVANRDYIRLLESKNWYGIPGEIKRLSRNIQSGGDSKKATFDKGLHLTIRLGLRGDVDPALKWSKPESHICDLLLQDISCYKNGIENFNYTVIGSKFEIYQPEQKFNLGKSCVLWLPDPDNLKDDIRKFINTIVNAQNCDSIIIADIRTYEAKTFVDALSGAKFNSETCALKSIIFLTERIQCFGLENKNGKLDISTEYLKIFLEGDVNQEPSLRNVFSFLRYHDSRAFWNKIESLKHGYIDQWVNWGVGTNQVDQYLYGYLDMELALREKSILELAQVGLERVCGIRKPGESVELHAIDSLSESVCENFNSIGDRYQTMKEHTLELGSIYVSGRTQKITKKEMRDSIYLLRHPYFKPEHEHRDSKNVPILSIFNWKKLPPKYDPEIEKIEYYRVGDTHSVSPRGSKHYFIPKLVNGSYTSYRTPKEQYDDIQYISANSIRLGHWGYRGKHDVFGINLRLHLKYAFDTKSPLAEFLVNELVFNIGIPKSKILDLNYKKLKKVSSRKAIVVYPSHPTTDRAIVNIKNIIKREHQSDIQYLYIGVRPVRNSSSSVANLISPESERNIAGAVKATKIKNVVLFDDGVLTGRTNLEIGAFVEKMGCRVVKVVTILNRQRVPGVDKRTPEIIAFWRFDLPTLGSDRSCLICRAIRQLKIFYSEGLTSNQAKERVLVWIDEWRAKNPFIEWSGSGLNSTPIDSYKKFRSEQLMEGKEDDNLEVHLKSSSALALFSAELTTMTGLDDHALKFFKTISENSESIAVDLFTSHILLFSSDLPIGIKIDLITMLLRILIGSRETDLRTMFCSIVILAEFLIDTDTVASIVKEIFEEVRPHPLTLNFDCRASL